MEILEDLKSKFKEGQRFTYKESGYHFTKLNTLVDEGYLNKIKNKNRIYYYFGNTNNILLPLNDEDSISYQIKRLESDKIKIEKLLNIYNNYDKNLSIYDLSGKEFFTACIGLNAQAKAPKGEKFIAKKLNLKKVPASAGLGDFTDGVNYYEMKTSYTNKGNNLNLRQIRLYQSGVGFYICNFINENDLEKSLSFKLTKQQMEQEVSLLGGYTHGTKEVNQNNVNPEYSITIPMYGENNSHYNRWITNYLDENIKNQILS